MNDGWKAIWEQEYNDRFGFLDSIIEKRCIPGDKGTNFGHEIREFIRAEMNCRDALISSQAEEIKKLQIKCANLDKILGSLDVENPNATDALLQTLTMQKAEIERLRGALEVIAAGDCIDCNADKLAKSALEGKGEG